MRGNCRLFLGMFLVSLISGKTAEQVSGFKGGNVVLPCRCENRDTSRVFSWQKINIQEPLAFRLEGQNESYGKDFEGRVELFYLESPNNCSILLKNINVRDRGSYRCYWTMTPSKTFNYTDVDLNVSDPHTASQRANKQLSEIQTTPTSTENPQTEKPDWKMLWMIAILVLGL